MLSLHVWEWKVALLVSMKSQIGEEEFENAIRRIMSNSPRVNGATGEMIKYGGEILRRWMISA